MSDKNIRFINSHYDDLFKIPDGGVVEVSYPDRPDRNFLGRCEYIDDYHLRMGNSVLHICQLAEILERNGGIVKPEETITAEACAWSISDKTLALQTMDGGYVYKLFDKNYAIIDGGQIDDSSITMNEARDQILNAYGLGDRNMTPVDYDTVLEMAENVELKHRESVLGKLADMSGKAEAPTKTPHKSKEAER